MQNHSPFFPHQVLEGGQMSGMDGFAKLFLEWMFVRLLSYDLSETVGKARLAELLFIYLLLDR